VTDVTEYDPAWPGRAETARAELLSRLPGLFTAIEHIGSTSVPGLAAKPVIDLMAAADDLDRVARHDGTVAELGYRRFDTGMPGRLVYFRDEHGRRACHLHVVPAASWETRNERLLRDHLLSHPGDVVRYAELKKRLAAEHTDGIEYTKAKTELIQELTDRARADRGLPSVPVWEELSASVSGRSGPGRPGTPSRLLPACPLLVRSPVPQPSASHPSAAVSLPSIRSVARSPSSMGTDSG
jgi:GrpB-like predicted nucleotidyltransferase (UPF0157 family)